MAASHNWFYLPISIYNLQLPRFCPVVFDTVIDPMIRTETKLDSDLHKSMRWQKQNIDGMNISVGDYLTG